MAAPLINTDLSYWRSRRRIGNSDYDDQIKQGLKYFQDNQQEIQALVDQYGWNKASDMLYEQAGPAERNQMSMLVVYDAIEDAYSPDKTMQRMALGQTPKGEILQNTNTGIITPSEPTPISLTPTGTSNPQNRSYNDGASGVSIASVPGSSPTRVGDPSSASMTSDYRFDRSAPAGWAVNSTGNFVRVPEGYVQNSSGYFVPASQAQAPAAPTSGTRSDIGAPASMSVPQTQSGQPVRIGPTQLAQLQGQGLTENDIVRQGTDILIKPTSRFYSQVSQGGTTPAASSPSSTAVGTTGQTPNTPASVEAAVNPADKAWIDSYYKKYFDRNATSSELTNWAKESPQALEQFLQKEAKTYGYTSSYFKDDGNKRMETAMNIINSSNLPQGIKDLWAATVAGYPSGMEYNAQEVLNTFNHIKTSTIDPQFAELATIAARDFQRNLNEQKSKFEMDQEALRANAGQNIRQAKEGLEKSGMTFSGKAIEDLGANSAFAQSGTSQPGAIPQQQPFGGLFYEGNVNQQNRLMASSASLANKSTMDALNASLEQQLGSNAAAAAGATVQGGITGALETQRQSQYGQTLQQIMDNYRKKQTLNTNITT